MSNNKAYHSCQKSGGDNSDSCSSSDYSCSDGDGFDFGEIYLGAKKITILFLAHNGVTQPELWQRWRDLAPFVDVEFLVHCPANLNAEELDPKQQLNTQFLKDINGGGTSFRGRVIRSDEQVEFQWITKQILAFNSDNMPRFDISNKAILDRMIVVQHRARFCPTKDEYEREIKAEKPYTHEANPDVDEKIHGEWRAALLEWCLGGMAAYKEKGFTTRPATCDQWVKKLAEEQDLVNAFVKTSLEYTGDTSDVLPQTDAYQVFKRNTPEERDKKTTIGKTKFFDRLKRCQGDGSFKDQHGTDRKRNVYLGWKMNEGESYPQI